MPEPYDYKDEWVIPMTEEENRAAVKRVIKDYNEALEAFRNFTDGDGQPLLEETDDA